MTASGNYNNIEFHFLFSQLFRGYYVIWAGWGLLGTACKLRVLVFPEELSKVSPWGFRILSSEICHLPAQITSQSVTLLSDFWSPKTAVCVFVREGGESGEDFSGVFPVGGVIP